MGWSTNLCELLCSIAGIILVFVFVIGIFFGVQLMKIKKGRFIIQIGNKLKVEYEGTGWLAVLIVATVLLVTPCFRLRSEVRLKIEGARLEVKRFIESENFKYAANGISGNKTV